ncbi:PQQ-binding-like beta-propeller repeat protein [Galbibacter sp. BG1]|uniref:outer membrane protein assembly factor BamB family protein n=1 Tax=Galbibacter sp. BG1 TaxID=1170699 RepID=UPI0015BBB585|nr:PQQ-binding-like beta-propeller repeat protein [Galbibacter sp. BG1]QLE02448.1 PQQ-binding-like beta-propeller repeat protein [Galbibacter sp. BG1]
MKLFVLNICLLISLTCYSQLQKDTGLTDIDKIRQEIKEAPTDSINFKGRRAALFRYWRLLWRQGYDLTNMDTLSENLITDFSDAKKNYENIDKGFLALDSLYFIGKKIEQINSNAVRTKKLSKTNWPYYLGTENRQTGYSPDPGPTKGKIAWKFPKGYHSTATPVLENGRLFISSPGIDVNGFCLDQKTGKVLWRSRQMGIDFYTDHGSRWTPVVTQKNVIIRNAFDEESIHVVDKSTGQPSKENKEELKFAYTRLGKTLVVASTDEGKDIWTHNFQNYITNQPKVHNEMVLVALRNGEVYSFSLSTGEIVWNIDLDTELVGTPSIGNEQLIIGNTTGKLFSIKVKNGNLNWSFQAEEIEKKSNQFYSGAHFYHDQVFIGASNKNLYCFSPEGKQLWKLKLSDWIRAAPVTVNNYLYAASFDGLLHKIDISTKKPRIVLGNPISEHPITADLVGNNNGVFIADQNLVLHAVSPNSLETLWQHGIVDGIFDSGNYYKADWAGGLLGTPTIVDGVAYIGGPDGFVNAVNVETGKEIWRFETNSTVSLAPTVVDERIFFGYLGANTEHYGYENPGEYFALNKNTGEPIWSSKEFGRVWVSATYADGKLFFGNTDGFVFAVNPENGNIMWKYNTAKDTPKEKIPLTTPFTHGFPSGVYSIPTKDDKNFYVGSWSGYYFAFDQKTGALKWRTKTSANDYGGLPDSAAPILYKGYLYVQKKGGAVAALNVKKGEIAWEWYAKRGHLQNASVAANRDMIFTSTVRKVISLPYTSTMRAFNSKNIGNPNKIWELDNVGGLTAPVITDKTLITGSSTSMFITGISPDTGKILWRVFTGGEMLENAPALYGNKVLALCKNGYLFAIE